MLRIEVLQLLQKCELSIVFNQSFVQRRRTDIKVHISNVIDSFGEF